MEPYSLDEIYEKSKCVLERYNIGRAVIFGSYARGEASKGSDIDIYIDDKGSLKGLFQLSGLLSDLQECFGCKVDLISGEIKDLRLKQNILKEGVIIYENRQKCRNHKQDRRVLYTDPRNHHVFQK